MKIAIFGALDRQNYGDLLFPLVLSKYLEKINKQTQIGYYGLINADFTSYAGFKTQKFSSFYNEIQKNKSKSVIIIAGGAIIGGKAGKLYSFLHPTPFRNILSTPLHLLRIPNPADFIAKRKLNINWSPYPFCIPKPSDNCLVIYNSVGDKFRHSKKINDILNQADYLSVRNKNLYDGLKSNLTISNVTLTVDSASVMSKLWPMNSLESIVTDKTKKITDKFKKGYISFQAKGKNIKHLKIIKNQLEILYSKTGLGIILTPIGTALRHEDDILLRSLKKESNIPIEIVDVVNIFDTMYSIAKSKLFIGTSLHGNITAMSYGIKHLAITKIPKLDQYIKYWDIEPIKSLGCVKLNEFYEKSMFLINSKIENELLENSAKLVSLADLNLNRIVKLIESF